MKVALTGLGGKGLDCGDAEWRARLALAACYRLVDHYGMTDLVYTHITAAVPGEERHFLINPYGLMFDEITASSLVKVDLDGNVLSETGFEINPAGYVIHSAIHAAREDVECVLHTHSVAGTAVSVLEGGLQVLDQQSSQFHERIAYHDWEGFALDEDEKPRLVADLGDKRAMIMRNHGLIVAGRSVPEAFRLIYYLERACRLQLQVMASGAKISPPSPEVCEKTARAWDESSSDVATIREWPALIRMLDRKDPSYRD